MSNAACDVRPMRDVRWRRDKLRAVVKCDDIAMMRVAGLLAGHSHRQVSVATIAVES